MKTIFHGLRGGGNKQEKKKSNTTKSQQIFPRKHRLSAAYHRPPTTETFRSPPDGGPAALPAPPPRILAPYSFSFSLSPELTSPLNDLLELKNPKRPVSARAAGAPLAAAAEEPLATLAAMGLRCRDLSGDLDSDLDERIQGTVPPSPHGIKTPRETI
ncbi:unnamed protein product [Ectocarpus sp. 12 AP-2014]